MPLHAITLEKQPQNLLIFPLRNLIQLHHLGPGPPLFFASTSAPWPKSSLTMESRPCKTATCQASSPRCCVLPQTRSWLVCQRREVLVADPKILEADRVGSLLAEPLFASAPREAGEAQHVVRRRLLRMGVGNSQRQPPSHFIPSAHPLSPGPSLFLASMSARCFSSSSTMELWPSLAAKVKAVSPWCQLQRAGEVHRGVCAGAYTCLQIGDAQHSKPVHLRDSAKSHRQEFLGFPAIFVLLIHALRVFSQQPSHDVQPPRQCSIDDATIVFLFCVYTSI